MFVLMFFITHEKLITQETFILSRKLPYDKILILLIPLISTSNIKFKRYIKRSLKETQPYK